MLDLSKFAGDSSRLWSSDSSSSSEEREEKEGSSQVGLGSSQVHDLDGDADLQDWLQAFKSDGISDSDGSSAHTSDGEFPTFRLFVVNALFLGIAMLRSPLDRFTLFQLLLKRTSVKRASGC